VKRVDLGPNAAAFAGELAGPLEESDLDPKGGYTPDNIRLGCTAVNLGIGDWGDEVLLTIAKGVSSVSRRALQETRLDHTSAMQNRRS
jgi:hypothetical protein